MDAPLVATVVVVSDEVASGLDPDRAGPVAVAELAQHGVTAALVVVGDDVEAIRDVVRTAISASSRIVLTCGGTGIGPGDVTPEAVAPLLSFPLPGIGEEIRRRGAQHVASALVSREVAGVILGEPSTFVLAGPGSRGGVRDAVAVVGPLLAHIVAQLDGVGHL